jgi:hypothetical protein
MPRVAVKSERLPDGGYVVSAHTQDWDLMQSFPHAIAQDIVDAIVRRFVEENGDLIMDIVKDPELLATALSKEIDLRVRTYIAERKKRDAR